MKKIVILNSTDFIEPPKSNQHVFCSTLKHGDMAQIERDFDVIIYNENVIANRYGSAGKPIDLNALIAR